MTHVTLSHTDDWKLKYGNQDIRGWPVRDATGNRIGSVDKMLIDTDVRKVDTIVLDDGRKYPARDITIGDEAVHLKDPEYRLSNTRPASTESVAAEDTAKAFRSHYDTTYADTGRAYAYYEPAYRFGHEMRHDPRFTELDYKTAEPELRRIYESRHRDSPYNHVREAMRHAFGHRADTRRTV